MSDDKLSFDDLRAGYSYRIDNAMLKRYIPDIPVGVQLYLDSSTCTAEPFNPYTSVYAQINYMDLSSPDFGDPEGEFNQFDIRRPEEFDYIEWLRSVFYVSDEPIDEMLDNPSEYAPNDDEWEMPERVQLEILRTNYHEWYNSWMKRGCPICTGFETVDRYNGHGVRKAYHEEYPLDPNLTASERK